MMYAAGKGKPSYVIANDANSISNCTEAILVIKRSSVIQVLGIKTIFGRLHHRVIRFTSQKKNFFFAFIERLSCASYRRRY